MYGSLKRVETSVSQVNLGPRLVWSGEICVNSLVFRCRTPTQGSGSSPEDGRERRPWEEGWGVDQKPHTVGNDRRSPGNDVEKRTDLVRTLVEVVDGPTGSGRSELSWEWKGHRTTVGETLSLEEVG